MKLSRIPLLLAVILLLTALAPAAYADETEATETTVETVEETVEETKAEIGPPLTEGTCGKDLSWKLSGSTLTITGSGEMEDGSPWAESAWKIKTVILKGEVTSVGAGAFAEIEALTAVDFGSSLKEIGEAAFLGCTGLTEISLPDTFRRFGPDSFAGCSALETIHCAGGMPSFKGGCLRDCGYITIYYPGNNPWPQEEIQRLAANFGGLEILMASSDTPKPAEVVPEETEERLPAETEPLETEPETVPTAVATQPPETEPETVPPTTQTATEAPAAEAAAIETEGELYTLPTMAAEDVEEPEERGLGGGIIAMILIAGVLTFFIVGALIAKSARRPGGKYGR